MTDSNNDRVALPPALLTHLQDSNWDATLAYLQQAKAAARPQQDTHERVAAAAGQGQGDGDLAWVRSRDAAQAWLIAHICLHGSRKHYAEVLAPACGSGGLGLSTNTGIGTATGGIQNQKEGLDAVTADHVTPPTPGDIRRALKRIALLIHPDKCALPSAARAFQYAQEAQAALLRDTPGKHGLRPPRKRRRRNSPGPTPCSPRTTSDHQHGPCQDNTGIDGNSSDYTSTDSEGYYSGSSEGEQEEDEGYRWWDAWDVRGSQLPTPLHMRQGAGQHAGADSKQEEEGRLWQMPIVDLRALVAQRQSGLLRPTTPEDAPLSIYERQSRLRSAREVLSARMAGASGPMQHDPGVTEHACDTATGAECRTVGADEPCTAEDRAHACDGAHDTNDGPQQRYEDAGGFL